MASSYSTGGDKNTHQLEFPNRGQLQYKYLIHIPVYIQTFSG